MMTPLSHAVMAEYDELDVQLKCFVAATGLACPAGCGACCNSPKVQATVLEVLPLAEALAAQAPVERWLEKLELAPATCAFFAPDSQNPEGGRCQTYATRPLLCRLHGFAARRNKNGGHDLVACRIMKANQPEQIAAVKERVIQDPELAPVYSDWAARISGLNPNLGTSLLPINEAIAEALRWIGMRLQYTSLVLLPSPDDENHDPTTPSRAA